MLSLDGFDVTFDDWHVGSDMSRFTIANPNVAAGGLAVAVDLEARAASACYVIVAPASLDYALKTAADNEQGTDILDFLTKICKYLDDQGAKGHQTDAEVFQRLADKLKEQNVQPRSYGPEHDSISPE